MRDTPGGKIVLIDSERASCTLGVDHFHVRAYGDFHSVGDQFGALYERTHRPHHERARRPPAVHHALRGRNDDDEVFFRLLRLLHPRRKAANASDSGRD